MNTTRYEICIAGHLGEQWEDWFEGLSLERTPEGETHLQGKLDQAALHGVLNKIRDLGLKIIEVKTIDMEQES